MQHQNALSNDAHANNVDTPVNGGDGECEDEVIKCDINKELATA